jgi:mRNA-degrading endonuclease toxin of MazEF toxin-antitoxin module
MFLFSAWAAGLPRDFVANPTQIVSLDNALLSERIAKLSKNALAAILGGIDIILGR